MDRRKFLSYRIAKDFRERFIERFAELGVELHVMVGNHDTYFKNTNDVKVYLPLLEKHEVDSEEFENIIHHYLNQGKILLSWKIS